MATKKPCSDLTKRSRSPVVLEAEMFSEFQEWCLRTYGDSGKTKTVTRRKYNKIMQTLLQNEDTDGVYVDNSHINAKFKFWVRSKGFQVGSNVLGEHNQKGAPGKPVLYVPVKSTVMCFFFLSFFLLTNLTLVWGCVALRFTSQCVLCDKPILSVEHFRNIFAVTLRSVTCPSPSSGREHVDTDPKPRPSLP